VSGFFTFVGGVLAAGEKNPVKSMHYILAEFLHIKVYE